MFFPKPSGNYSVGITRTEFSYKGKESSILPLTIFYPGKEEGEKRARYTFAEALYKIPIYKLRTKFYLNPKVSKSKEKYPVIIYNHGYRSYEMSNSILCGELASRGFIVIGIGHTREATAVKLLDGQVIKLDEKLNLETEKAEEDGRLQEIIKEVSNMAPIEENNKVFIEKGRIFNEVHDKAGRMDIWKDRIIKTADHLNILNSENEILKGYLDLERGFGITGHSFGGAAAIPVCREDKRFICGINIDGANLEYDYGKDINKPFMTIGTEITNKLLKAIYINNSKDSYQLILKDTDHMSFTDLNFFPLVSKVLKIPLGKMNKHKVNKILTEYQVEFFNKYLLKKDIDIEAIKDKQIILNKYIKIMESENNE